MKMKEECILAKKTDVKTKGFIPRILLVEIT